MNAGALSGITVIDLTRILAGPYCSMMMADMGANVIKLEVPGKGDESRKNYPLLNGESCYYMNLNRNKRGITLNLKTEEGKRIFKELAAKADVVLENFKPGVMDRLGVGYEELRKVNPRIIYGCVSGFGHYGPYKERPGYDIIGQAMSGLMSTTGWPDTPPTRSGTALSDVLGGISMCIGVLAAYINREKTGEGQKVDVALVDATVSSLEIINQIYLNTGRLPTRIGNRYEASYPYDSFNCKDGMMVIGAGNDRLFTKLINVMGMPELMEDERFNNNIKRVNNHAELKPIIEAWLSRYTVEEAVNMLLAASVPAGPIYNIAQVAADPHIAGAREMFLEMEHPIAGKVKITGNQIKMSQTPVSFDRPAPMLGQHTRQIMREMLDMDDETYHMLSEKGVF